MKIIRSANSIGFEFKNGIFINLYEEYSQFFNVKQYNWCDITFIKVGFELDRQCGDYEFSFNLLGFGLTIRVPHETEKSKEFFNLLETEKKKINKWKTVWVEKCNIKNINYLLCALKRPKKYKDYVKGYLQLEE